MKLKNIIRLIILIPLSIYFIYCSYHFITNETRPTYLDCGKVVSKSADEVVIKRGVMTELYLNVQFSKSGFRSIKCDPTTYFSKQIGNNVCFKLNEDVSVWYDINNLIGMLILLIFGIIILICLIFYLIPKSWYD